MTSDQADPGQRPIHDPRVLRGIAHPVRNRILGELSASGPMRAADVARDLDIPANQASFHLRQLAKYGLVEEAPEEARDKRDRVWRVTSEQGVRVNLSELADSPGGKAAVSVFRRVAIANGYRVIDEAYSSDAPPDTFRAVSDESLKLTKSEATELAGELEALLSRWSVRTRGHAGERRTYQVFQVIQPYPQADGPLPTRDS